jgi:hypothetical protein
VEANVEPEAEGISAAEPVDCGADAGVPDEGVEDGGLLEAG